MKKLSKINTREDFAEFLGISIQYLTYILYGKNNNDLYTSFKIPKKSGGERMIDAPIGPLKYIQRKLAQKIIEHMNYMEDEYQIKNKISHGFVKNKSIITNAEIHRNKRYVLNVDLEDFFPTLHFGRVRGFFIKNKYFKLDPKIATIIAQLSCHDGALPQGAPTSPIIANLIANILDLKILKLTQKYQLDYTRYVDDLSFSTNEKNFINEKKYFLQELEKIINQSGFKINKNKSRIQYCNSRQAVTGLTVNQIINTKKEFRRNTRAMAHKLYFEGQFEIDGEKGTIKQLSGRFSFINQLDWYNRGEKVKNDEYIPYHNLTSREKEYQKFIYYQKFFHNQKPLIITEGKTDIIYLRAALKKLYQSYPNLISKNLDGKKDYKISFFKRYNRKNKNQSKQNKLEYFFNISQDGADPLKKVIDIYIGTDDFPGYWEFFNTKKGQGPSNPVIIILDNESDRSKPLQIFIEIATKNIIYFLSKNQYHGEDKRTKKKLRDKEMNKFRDKIKLNLKERNYSRIFGNIYLITLPKANNKDVEIEDLFNEKIIKSFNSKHSKPSDKILNKNKRKFSDFVFNNYKAINFDKFKSVFDNIDTITKLYNGK